MRYVKVHVVVGRASDLRSREVGLRRGFDSWASYSHLYHVPVCVGTDLRWCLTVGKITVSVTNSNGSLYLRVYEYHAPPPWLPSILGLPGSSPASTRSNYGYRTLPYRTCRYSLIELSSCRLYGAVYCRTSYWRVGVRALSTLPYLCWQTAVRTSSCLVLVSLCIARSPCRLASKSNTTISLYVHLSVNIMHGRFSVKL